MAAKKAAAKKKRGPYKVGTALKIPKEPGERGRRLLDIDPEQVEKLARINASMQEMAMFFGCSEKTLHARFQPEINKGKTGVKLRVRQLQLKAAEGGNVTMLIWLGKQMLGQVDQPVVVDTDKAVMKMKAKDVVNHWRAEMGQQPVVDVDEVKGDD